MLSDLLPEIVEQIVWYLTTEDLQNVCLCSSAYNRSWEGYLWRNVRISFTQLLHQDFTNKQNITQNLNHLSNTCCLHLGYQPYRNNHIEHMKRLQRNFELICDTANPATLHAYFLTLNIFDQLQKFSKLSELHFHVPSMADNDFQVLCVTLNQIKVLNVAYTSVTDGGFAHLQKLVSLRELDISFCPITDDTLWSVGELSCLETLSMSGCRNTTDDGLAVLTRLKLTRLIMRRCHKTDAAVPYLCDISSLKVLDLEHNALTDLGLSCLSQLSYLVELNIGSNDCITGEGIQFLSSLSLTKLGVSMSSSEPPVHWQRGFTSLTDLDLSYCDVTDEEFTCLEKLPLRRLNLTGSDVDDEALMLIQGLTSLRCLHLRGSFGVEDQGLKYLERFKELEELTISWCSNVGLSYVAALNALTTLSIFRTSITDLAVVSYLKNLRFLNELHLNSCKGISGRSFSYLNDAIPLQVLKLVACEVHDETLASEHIGGLHKLRVLDLSCNYQVSNQGLSYIMEMKTLQRMSLDDCMSVTDAGVIRVCSDLRKCLRTISLTGTGVSQVCVDQLRSIYHLTVIDVVDVGYWKFGGMR